MTVLVGVLCEDGVAIGADSVETFGLEPGLRTIEQLGIKIDVVAGRAILAGTGYVGHMQRFRRRMEKLVKGSEGKSLAWNDAVESGALIAETMINEGKRTPSHLQHQPQFGYQFGALVAFASAAGPELFSFDPIQFQPERKGDADAERGDRTGRIVSLGSGQSLADPFLAFIRQAMWQNKVPTLPQGKLAVAWTLMQVIRFNTGGIGGKPQIAELRKDGKDWKAAMVDADEMMQQVQALEKYLGDYGQVTAGENVTPVPKPGDQN